MPCTVSRDTVHGDRLGIGSAPSDTVPAWVQGTEPNQRGCDTWHIWQACRH